MEIIQRLLYIQNVNYHPMKLRYRLQGIVSLRGLRCAVKNGVHVFKPRLDLYSITAQIVQPYEGLCLKIVRDFSVFTVSRSAVRLMEVRRI